MKRQFLPISALAAWATLNGIAFPDVAFEKSQSSNSDADSEARRSGSRATTVADKGSAVFAKAEKYNGDPEDETSRPEILISVPRDMVLSLGSVQEYAKSDTLLREVLDAVGSFGRTPRGAILIFLLLQITYTALNERTDNDPAVEETKKRGISHPWSEYIKFLPETIPIPTFYTEDERAILYGTSLKDAVDAKLGALEREFELLRTSTQNIPWCQRHWWAVETGQLSMDDWKTVDALYRSRALDLPGTGHAMVPCVDMANHAGGDDTVAVYETGENGDAVLQLRWGKRLLPGQEITITYGDDKGASEMIFSYGFLENTVEDAKQLFLDLDIPDDDPLKPAKRAICKDAPGVRLYSTNKDDNGKNDDNSPASTGWESGFVWWACVNEEDGLNFQVLQTFDGQQELRATWKGQQLNPDITSLEDLVLSDSQKDIFKLRANVIIQGRLERQLSLLEETASAFDEVEHDPSGDRTGIRTEVYETIGRLRKLEMDLLRRGLKDLSKEREDLLSSPTVKEFLEREREQDVDDFS